MYIKANLNKCNKQQLDIEGMLPEFIKSPGILLKKASHMEIGDSFIVWLQRTELGTLFQRGSHVYLGNFGSSTHQYHFRISKEMRNHEIVLEKGQYKH